MTTGIPHWDDDDRAWDLLVLGTQPMPGVWDIEDGHGKRVFDIKKAPGRDGAIIKDMGYEPGAMTLVGQLATAEDWEILQAVVESFRATQKEGKGSQEPIAISHPKTLLMNITQVIISEIDFPTLDNGIMTVRIRALEYVKPKAIKTDKGKPKAVTLESELASQDEQSTSPVSSRDWANAYLSEEQTSNQHRARQEQLARERAGATPLFTSRAPTYSPAGT